LDDEVVFEFQQDFSGGEDSFRSPTLIEPNQCQHLLNMMVRDNYEARTRPGADAIPTAATLPIANATAVYALRYFQIPAHSQLVAAVNVGGTGHLLSLEANVWSDLNLVGSYPAGFPNSPDTRLAMAQGIDTLLISDGVGQGVIWDGAAFTQTGAANNANFPIGATILAWFGGCMWASGVASQPDGIWASKSLAFSAGNWDATLRQFRVGGGDGDPIVALAPMQENTMAILKRNSVWQLSYSPEKDAAAATFLTANIARQALSYGIGCVGRDAWCAYGNDILFMAQDGVRSVQRMQAAAGQWQLIPPISQPIQPIIKRINQAAWDKIVAIKYQEFAMFFVPLDNSLTNNYCLVYNGQLQKWMGAWTNWKANCVELTRFSGLQRFVFGDTSGYVNQWKDLNSNTDDATYQDNGIGYPSQVSTRSFQFNEPIVSKNAWNAVMRFTSGNAALSLGWYADSALAKTWNGTFNPTGDILGVGTLPFLLASTSPIKVTKGLRGLAAFSEAYVSIQCNSGWFWLRNVTVSAQVNPLKEAS